MKIFRKPSVYIGLGIFLAGILATGWITNRILSRTGELSKNVEEKKAEIVVENVYEKETPEVKEVQSVSAYTPVEEEPAVQETPQQETFAFSAPVNGAVLVPFSGEKLVFSKTLEDYRKHQGVDIKSAILEKVVAAEAGVVKEVKEDPFLGITIVIDHENGFETVYANLSTAEMVGKGDRVEKGVIISGVGDTAVSETGEEAHLHFEIYKDGEAVNPEEYIDF